MTDIEDRYLTQLAERLAVGVDLLRDCLGGLHPPLCRTFTLTRYLALLEAVGAHERDAVEGVE